MTDHYTDGTYRWWHLSAPSPELRQAISDRWLPAGGSAIDIGCGLGTEAAFLRRTGWQVVGVDLVPAALTGAAARNPGPSYLVADLLQLPLQSAVFDAAIDRGCFHYLSPGDRTGYAREVRRVLRPGGKLLLRASLRSAGVRNDMNEGVISSTFADWTIEHMERAEVPSDTRSMHMLLVRLTAA